MLGGALVVVSVVALVRREVIHLGVLGRLVARVLLDNPDFLLLILVDIQHQMVRLLHGFRIVSKM